MFKCFKQKYKRRLDPNDETRSCFSIEHFSYDSDVVVYKGNLANHYQYWVAKSRRGFKPLFDSIHIKDEVKMDESDVNLVNKSIVMQKQIMNQVWKKAREELGEEQLGENNWGKCFT